MSFFDTVNARLGPSTPPDNRPNNYSTPPIPFPTGDPRVNPYQVGTPNTYKGDYCSDSGQVAYVPDGTLAPDDAGLAATKHYANYTGVFATGPALDARRGTPNPDPSTRLPQYQVPTKLAHVVAQVRSVGTTGNNAFVLWADGRITVASTQTGGANFPLVQLPAGKTPMDLAVTSNNELLVVAVHDETSGKGQLAVIAVEGAGIPFHTFKEMGLPNQASVSAMKLLGFVDLPAGVTTSLRVSAACNGHTNGPIGGMTWGQLDATLATSPTNLANLYNGAWRATIAIAGYAAVISRDEGQLVIVDLSPVLQYFRDSWLASETNYAETKAARGPDPTQWPQTFDTLPTITPKIVFQAALTRPVSILCGHCLDRWSPDCYKFHVGLEDGTISIWDASPIMARETWDKKSGTIHELGRIFVGENPISMCFSRRHEGQSSSILPSGKNGDGLNNVLWIACRKARTIVKLLTVDGSGDILKTVSDQLLGDPVNVVTCVRGYIVLVCDFLGKQVVGFRMGDLTDVHAPTGAITYPPALGKADYEVSGVLPLPGNPFVITSDNTN